MVLAAGIPVVIPRCPFPGVVLEILLGVIVGPQVLGLVHPALVLNSLASFGLAFVLLMAGFEIDFRVLRGDAIRLALAGWVMSCCIAFGSALLLADLGLVSAWPFSGLVMTTTAIGVLLPILRDWGLLVPPYGPLILGIGAVGEAGPIVVLSLLLAGHSAPLQSLVMLGFALAVIVAMGLAVRASTGRFGETMAHTIQSSGQLPIRLILFLLVLFAVVSDALRIEAVLGAFVAGAIARAAVRTHHLQAFAARLDGVGSAFLVPIFFITSGTRLDVAALVDHPAKIWMVVVYAFLMLLARGLPVWLLYGKSLRPAARFGLALHAGTQISLVVAITGIAVQQNLMPAAQATTLVLGGIVTVLAFPALSRRFLPVSIPLAQD
jgi:Kef-type K+ transport system membrane component KefB